MQFDDTLLLLPLLAFKLGAAQLKAGQLICYGIGNKLRLLQLASHAGAFRL
ncbi:hypothetical protein D3C80_2047290 [compost metagenome]